MEHLTLLVHLTDNADEMQFANLLSIYNTKCTLLLSAAYAILTVAFTRKKSSSGIFPSTKMAKGRSACWFVKLRMVMFVYEYEETSKQDLLFFTGATHIINALSYKGHKVKGGMN